MNKLFLMGIFSLTLMACERQDNRSNIERERRERLEEENRQLPPMNRDTTDNYDSNYLRNDNLNPRSNSDYYQQTRDYNRSTNRDSRYNRDYNPTSRDYNRSTNSDSSRYNIDINRNDYGRDYDSSRSGMDYDDAKNASPGSSMYDSQNKTNTDYDNSRTNRQIYNSYDSGSSTESNRPLPRDGYLSNLERDNTGVNVRDRDARSITPGDQSENSADLEITQKIRQALMADDALSINAKNIKIITNNRVVTLRGPVLNMQEKDAIARKIASLKGIKKVDNQLEVTRNKN